MAIFLELNDALDLYKLHNKTFFTNGRVLNLNSFKTFGGVDSRLGVSICTQSFGCTSIGICTYYVQPLYFIGTCTYIGASTFQPLNSLF